MDFRDLLQSLNSLNEATKETPTGRVHKAEPGGYGRKYDTDEEGDEKKKTAAPAAKRGRGRPKKGSDDSGEVKKYDNAKSLQSFMIGNKPKNLPGKASVKHKLKDWIEQVENDKLINENGITIKPMPGASQIVGADGKVIGTSDASTANTIKTAIDKGQLNLTGDEKLDELSRDTAKSYVAKKMDKIASASMKQAPSKEKVGRDLRALQRAHERIVGNRPTSETTNLPGNQDKLDIAEPKGKLDAKDFAKLRSMKHMHESVLNDSTGSTFQHICDTYKRDIADFKQTGEMSDHLYDALFDYYSDDMPYGVAKARTGDPYQWIGDRFEKDLGVTEGSKEMFTTHGMDSKPSKINVVDPNPKPTSWKVDPIQATTDRMIDAGTKAGSFIKNLVAPKKTFESKDMKDIQVENWERELNALLNEGITVSSSTGQQGSPDSVSVNATDADAEQLLQVLRQAGVGVFGGHEPEHSGYGAPIDPDAEGHGTEPEVAPEVVGDGDDMLALIKKMTGMGDESGHEDPDQSGALEPADGEEEGHEGSEDYKDEEDSEEHTGHEENGEEEEEVDEGNRYAYNVLKAKAAGKKEADLDGDGDMDPVKEDDMEEGNMFTGNLAKARAAGKDEADLDGDGNMEKIQKEGHEENCNECGYTMEQCSCEHDEQVEEAYANEPDEEMMKLKALLGMGNDLNRPKHSQTVGNPTKVAFESQIYDWKKLSGIK